ncbi:MAG: hypothetical protein AAF632_12080 [Bacteroidota bacterium]
MKLLPSIISLVVAGIFLYLALNSPNAFNLVPIALYDSFLQDVMKESTFINLFDILFALALMRFTYNLVSRITRV